MGTSLWPGVWRAVPWRKICLSCMRWAPVPQPSSLLRGLPSCHQEWPSVVGPWQLQLQPRTFSLLTTVILYLIVISSILPHLCSNWSIYPIPMVLNCGWFCISSPTPCPEDISQCLESFLVVTTVDVLPASRRQGLGILLSLLQCTVQAPFPPRQILELFLRVASCCSAPCLTNSQASQTPFSASSVRGLLSSPWIPSPCTVDQKVPPGRKLGSHRHLVYLLRGIKALHHPCAAPENDDFLHFVWFSSCLQQKGESSTSYLVIARDYLLRYFSPSIFLW